jgi:hypothetical protein
VERMSEPSSAHSRGDWSGWPIEANGLTKRYRETPVVDGIDLMVRDHRIAGRG